MCDPLTIGGAALTAGSAFANSAAAGRVATARDRALDFARAQQAQLDQQAAGINDRSRGRYDNFAGQQGADANSLASMFGQKPAETQAVQLAAPGSSSNIVNAENAKQAAKTDAYGKQQADALGGLRSFGDTMGTIGRGVARDAGEIAQINGFKAGDAALIPYALDSAGHAGDNLKSFGDLLGGVGKLGVQAGLRGNTGLSQFKLW